jgi:hypothetical protein
METLSNALLAEVLRVVPSTLRRLSLEGCKKITHLSSYGEELPENLAGLEVLDLTRCENLAELPPLASLGQLRELKVLGCKHLAQPAKQLEQPPSEREGRGDLISAPHFIATARGASRDAKGGMARRLSGAK